MRLLECKAPRSVTPAMAKPMQRLAAAIKERESRRKIEMKLIHRPARTPVATRAVAPNVKAVDWREYVGSL